MILLAQLLNLQNDTQCASLTANQTCACSTPGHKSPRWLYCAKRKNSEEPLRLLVTAKLVPDTLYGVGIETQFGEFNAPLVCRVKPAKFVGQPTVTEFWAEVILRFGTPSAA